MNCMNCGAPLGRSMYCPSCGKNVQQQKKAEHLSNLYYNQGLEKAQIRDLSGAEDLLLRSLKFNKLNIPARNLLGLVYYEMGEAVSALSEWIISKNFQRKDNLASDYIERLQKEANKLDSINLSIKKFNEALRCCREGNEDVAVIQLKKIIQQNHRLIKAHHLLALIYIHQEKYEKARKILKKAIRIDRTNSTTLRYLKEVEEKTGTATNLDSRWTLRERRHAEAEESSAYQVDNEIIIQPPAFRESSAFATLMNVGLGLVIGACVLWFLIVPATTQRINREANEKVVGYSNAQASQAAELAKKEEEIAQSQETVDSANEQIAQAEEKVAAYENLIKASEAYNAGNFDQTVNALETINADLLSVESRELYDTIQNGVKGTLFKRYYSTGTQAYSAEDYPAAIESLKKAVELDGTDYKAKYYLAHAYRLNEQYPEALELLKQLAEENKGTRKGTEAESYVSILEKKVADAGTSAPAEGGEGGNGEGTGADAGEGAAAGNGAPQEEGAAAGNGAPAEGQ